MLKSGMVALLALASTGVIAADLPVAAPVAPPPPPVVPVYQFVGWELRAGGLAHDPTSPEAGSVDLNGEILTPKFYHVTNSYWDLAVPRLALGGTANFAGKTSLAYADLAWTFDLPYRLFVEGQFGGAANNGKGGAIVPPGFNKLGCNVMFHEAGSVGFHLTESWSIMGTVEHTSNAGLCNLNRGLTNYGVRVGYRF